MTTEQEQYIITNWNTCSCEALRRSFNERYGTAYKTTAFHYHTKRLGLSKYIEHKYTKEQDDFLRKNSPRMTRQELTDSFNKKYGTSIKINTINQRCSLKGWSAGDDGKFKAGSVPWEKTIGGRDAYIEKIKGGNSTSFKKGFTPYNVLPVGMVRVRDGIPMIKTDSGWKRKTRALWESVNGDVPQGCVVIPADGNVNTENVKNLRMITNRTLTTLMANNWYGKGDHIVDCGIAWSSLKDVLTKEI